MWGDNFIVVFIYISLIMSDTEHIFMCLLAICVSLRNVWVFGPFFDWAVFSSCWAVWAAYIFWRWILFWLYNLQLFSLILRLCFNPVYFLCYARCFSLIKSHFHYSKATTPFLNAASFSWYLIINVSSSVWAICCLKDTQPFSAYLDAVQFTSVLMMPSEETFL